jgi:carboxyl-terminal processing protease
MKSSRSVLLIASTLLVLLLLGGGVAVRVGAAENSYRQAVLFAEILSLVLDNYVDPVETDLLLQGAYEGLLGGLDPNGAYLTPDEVREWHKSFEGERVGAGVTVLRVGRSLEIVAVDPGSSAEESGVLVGDQVRSIDGREVRDLSLAQGRRLLMGRAGSTVELGLLRPADGFSRKDVELIRSAPVADAYELTSDAGIAVLSLRDIARVSREELSDELDDIRSGGVDSLLVDLRNVANAQPRDVLTVAGLFVNGEVLHLRDGSGEVLESLEIPAGESIWDGAVSVLVNGATADGAEALTRMLQTGREATIYGESTFGLGAEPELLELENGAALLVSVALWETASGAGWNGDGIDPDREVSGEGREIADAEADQLKQVLELIHDTEPPVAETKAA